MSLLPDEDYTDDAVERWSRIVDDVDVSPIDVTMRIRRAATVLEEQMEAAVVRSGLGSLGEYDVLSVLRRAAAPLSPSSLADRLRLTRSGMTSRLGRLHTLGLIERETDPTDGRGVLIALSRSGAAKADRMFKASLEVQEAMLSALSGTEREALAAALRRLLLDAADEAPSTDGRSGRPSVSDRGAPG